MNIPDPENGYKAIAWMLLVFFSLGFFKPSKTLTARKRQAKMRVSRKMRV